MFLVLIVVNPLIAAAVDWCSKDLECPNAVQPLHTMCRFRDELETPRCTGILDLQNDDNRHLILQLHNVYRKKIAVGEVPGWPTAANMRRLRYDKTLEKVAFRWATQCWPHHHDWCRKTQKWPHVGQNIVRVFSSTPIFEANPDSDVKEWWKGIKNTNSTIIDRYSKQESSVAHFTQMIWATTEKVGCAMVAYKVAVGVTGPYLRVTVCNYGPGGNVFDYPVYLRGQPCSRCYRGDCVCGISRIVKRMPFERYTDLGMNIVNVTTGNSMFVNVTKVYPPFYPQKTERNVENAKFGTRDYWCSDELTCDQVDPPQHTMCLYKNEVETPRCTGIVSLMTDCVRERIVRSHNLYRRKIAIGEVPGWPPAANMRALTYDKKLEEIAYRWATQCMEEHDKCRKMMGWFSVGQNIAREYGNKPQTIADPEEDVEAWWNEVDDADPNIVDSFFVPVKRNKRPTGHFVQLVWADTDKIGCAMISYRSTKPSYYPYVRTTICNYGTGGNVMSYPVYEKGPPCSRCPPNVTCVCDLKKSKIQACKETNLSDFSSYTSPHMDYKSPVIPYSTIPETYFPESISTQSDEGRAPLTGAYVKFNGNTLQTVPTKHPKETRIALTGTYNPSYSKPKQFTNQPFDGSWSYLNYGSGLRSRVASHPSKPQRSSRADLVKRSRHKMGACVVYQGLQPPYIVAYKRPKAKYVSDLPLVKPECVMILSSPKTVNSPTASNEMAPGGFLENDYSQG